MLGRPEAMSTDSELLFFWQTVRVNPAFTGRQPPTQAHLHASSWIWAMAVTVIEFQRWLGSRKGQYSPGILTWSFWKFWFSFSTFVPSHQGLSALAPPISSLRGIQPWTPCLGCKLVSFI